MANGHTKLLSIGEVARASGLAATALRYYEREGVLGPTERSEAGYRLYDGQTLERLQFIPAAQAVGFTLDDIRTLLGLDDGETRSQRCRAEVRGLIEKRLKDVEEKMQQLQHVKTALAAALERCVNTDDWCPVLRDLHASTAASTVRGANGDKRLAKKR